VESARQARGFGGVSRASVRSEDATERTQKGWASRRIFHPCDMGDGDYDSAAAVDRLHLRATERVLLEDELALSGSSRLRLVG
jgi:hypothetical protein